MGAVDPSEEVTGVAVAVVLQSKGLAEVVVHRKLRISRSHKHDYDFLVFNIRKLLK